MIKKFVRWLFDHAAQSVVGALVGNAASVAAVNSIVRALTTPSWESMWVIWTCTAAAAYVAFLKTSRWWVPILSRPTRRSENDVLNEADQRRIRIETGGQLRSLYHGAGNQALGGLIQQLEPFGLGGSKRTVRREERIGSEVADRRVSAITPIRGWSLEITVLRFARGVRELP